MPKTIYSYSKRTCNYCQVEYQPTHKEQKFCSLSCGNKNRKLNYTPIYEKICKNCNSPFFVNSRNKEKEFCSYSCAGVFSNKKRKKSGWEPTQCHKIKTKNSLIKYYNNGKLIYSVNKLKKLRDAVAKHRQHPDIVGEYSLVYFNTCYSCKKLYSAKNEKYSQLCPSCLTNHKDKRKQYEFKFEPINYPNLFDLNLLEKNGTYHSLLNPNGISKDHRVSISESIINDYDSYYITHPLNCELMPFKQNSSKHTKSSISYKELVEMVNEYDSLKF